MIYDNILQTIGNTPVVRLNRMAPENVHVYVKVESFNPMGSVKDRLAFAIINDAEEAGDLDTAVSHYMQVGESREFASASNRIGQILIGAGKIDESRKWFARQRDTYPRQREQLYGIEAELLREAGGSP